MFWFKQMDAPRPQRNWIHIDLYVPEDQARARVDAAIAAGGRIVYEDRAPLWWTLADPEGNWEFAPGEAVGSGGQPSVRS